MKKPKEIVVTIDGPAGGGKSSVAKILADRLDFDYLDTGAMYRSVALAALQRGIELTRPDEMSQLADTLHIENRSGKTYLDGQDVSEAIRSSEVTAATRYSASNPDIRRRMIDLQRQTAFGRQIVTEGRDQGTVAFPNALTKFYLTAQPEERARRRLLDLEQRGEHPDLMTILDAILTRDRQDSERQVGPLRKPEDAVLIESDGKTIGQVVSEMENHVRHALSSIEGEKR